MHLLKAALALFFALAVAIPARAAPQPVEHARGGQKSETLFATGLQAPDVEPLMRGLLAEGVQVAVFAACFLALDDDQTCIEIAGKARTSATKLR